jgi:hypothetical protein
MRVTRHVVRDELEPRVAALANAEDERVKIDP